MHESNLKESLTSLLQTLKRNRDQVPITELRTRYRQAYRNLCQKISVATETYAKSVMFSDIRIRPEYAPEAISIIEQTLASSGLQRQLSIAAFEHQDIDEITRLSTDLGSILQNALMPLYCSHISLILIPECLEDPASYPIIYSEVNNSIYLNHTWTEITLVQNKQLSTTKGEINHVKQ